MTQSQPGSARDHLMRAHALHAEDKIDDALAEARRAIEIDAGYVDAWSYLGTTLLTRKLDYVHGLEALEHAERLAPDDAGIVYGLGWAYDFVAYRLQRRAPQSRHDPIALYRLAAAALHHALDLDPEQQIKDDATDLLVSIEARLEQQ